MAVTTEINTAIADYLKATGRGATRIYLGRNQMQALLLWANEIGCMVGPDIEGSGRPEYNGREVFEVNDDDHLAVA